MTDSPASELAIEDLRVHFFPCQKEPRVQQLPPRFSLDLSLDFYISPLSTVHCAVQLCLQVESINDACTFLAGDLFAGTYARVQQLLPRLQQHLSRCAATGAG